MQPQTTYPLRLTMGQVIKMVGVVIVATTAGVYLALTNDRGINLFGLISLDPMQAQWIFWGFSGFSALICLPLSLATLWKGRMAKQRLEFTESGVWLPRSVWSSKHVHVPFAEVRVVKIVLRPRHRLIEIELSDRRFLVGETWLSTPTLFEEILTRLHEGMAKARQAEHHSASTQVDSSSS